MSKDLFNKRLQMLHKKHEELLIRPNAIKEDGNGIFDRYNNPILTASHIPLSWKYDLSPDSNRFLMERFGINAVFNAGAIKWNGSYLLAARVEGADRKSFLQ